MKTEFAEKTDAPGLKAVSELALGIKRKLPIILQNEVTECGLACIAMIATYHGRRIDLASLRSRYPMSQKGATLASVIDIFGRLDISTRPLRIEVESLKKLKMPCVLHWEMSHFVVLKSVHRTHILIHDPAIGQRRIPHRAVLEAFSGVVLEAWPGQDFQKKDESKPVRLLSLLGSVTGLSKSLGHIIALSFVLQGFGLFSPLLTQFVVDHALVAADATLLNGLVIGFGVLLLLSQSISVLSAWASMHFSTTWSVQWSANVFTHLLRLPSSYFEKRHLGDIVSRFSSLRAIQATLTTALLGGVIDSAMLIVVTVLMVLYSPTLSLVSFGAMILYAISRAIWYQPLLMAVQEQIISSAKQDTHFLESVRGARAIKLFGNEDNRRSAWLALLVDQVNSGLKIQKLRILYSLINGVVFGLIGIMVVWMAANMVIRGEFTVGMMIAFGAYQSQFGRLTSSLIDKFFDIKMVRLHGERLADILLTEQEKQPGDGRLVVSDNNLQNQKIEIRNLRFQYSEHDPYVLDGINLVVEPGECVAIMGPSGCGKTTLLHILLGILPPTEGEVLYGDLSISTVGAELLRGSVASVTQNDSLFAGSISDNISFFDSQADQSWIEECARLASIHDEIAAMPMGYNTFVGYLGSVLSGGQQQRVLLARALYRKPKVLILDEATSHLDIKRENMVGATIRGLHVTRIIVAHRPQTAEQADRIVVIDRGKIVSERRLSPQLAVTSTSTPRNI